MSDITFLRKLTLPTQMRFGKWYDLTVQQIIDTQGTKGLTYLVWVYYNSEQITFFDNILDILGITKKIRIEKPHKVSQKKYWEYDKISVKNRIKKENKLGDNEKLKLDGMRRKIQIGKTKDKKMFNFKIRCLNENRNTMRRKNQGHNTYKKKYE